MLDFLQKIGTESGLKEKDIDNTKNIGFTVYDEGVVTHKQNKHGLSGYYDKRYVLTDGSQNKIFWQHTERQKRHVNTFFVHGSDK